jgi:hypothetical protein
MSAKNPFPNKDRKALLMTLLKIMGGKTVVVSFSGGGDSGEITDAALLDADNKPIDLDGAMFEWESERAYHDTGATEWKTVTEVAEMSVNDILVRITEDALEYSELDWYNNDGGSGTLEIDLSKEPPVVSLSVGINYMHTQDHNFDFTNEPEET